VTITGTELTDLSDVSFGSRAATDVVFNSATSVTATSPPEGAGTVDVTASTPVGTSATSVADQFTYEAAPTVSGVSPVAGPLAGGPSVIITGTGFTGASAVDFGSTPATSFTVGSATSITVVSPAGGAARSTAPSPP
jgi:hypothetical protein